MGVSDLPFIITASFTQDLADFIESYAKDHNITRQEVLRIGLRRIISEESKQKEAKQV